MAKQELHISYHIHNVCMDSLLNLLHFKVMCLSQFISNKCSYTSGITFNKHTF